MSGILINIYVIIALNLFSWTEDLLNCEPSYTHGSLSNPMNAYSPLFIRSLCIKFSMYSQPLCWWKYVFLWWYWYTNSSVDSRGGSLFYKNLAIILLLYWCTRHRTKALRDVRGYLDFKRNGIGITSTKHEWRQWEMLGCNMMNASWFRSYKRKNSLKLFPFTISLLYFHLISHYGCLMVRHS